MKKTELKRSYVELRDDGILHIHLRAGAELQLNDAVEIVETMGKIGEGKKFPVYIDAGDFASVDKEVRIFSASEAGNIYTLADAIAYSSFAQKLIAEFYVRHNKPSVPTQIFDNTEKAIEWLKGFLKK